MDSKGSKFITIKIQIRQPVSKVWEYWTDAKHITRWNFATDSWHCPRAVNNLKEEGAFSWRMEAKDGSMGFDYSGVYEQVKKYEYITCRLDDGRRVKVSFTEHDSVTEITETFEPEDSNSIELQRNGWTAILNNFKKYAETE